MSDADGAGVGVGVGVVGLVDVLMEVVDDVLIV